VGGNFYNEESETIRPSRVSATISSRERLCNVKIDEYDW